jgi:hypothetical protein
MKRIGSIPALFICKLRHTSGILFSRALPPRSDPLRAAPCVFSFIAYIYRLFLRGGINSSTIYGGTR